MHFLGHYEFKSCKASMFALLVKEELESWPEQSMRQRSWLTIREAQECCRNKWMRDALVEDFTKWHDDQMHIRIVQIDQIGFQSELAAAILEVLIGQVTGASKDKVLIFA
ncbi:hypothetical protein K2173_017969 [Erythroxylum novogranatense]|uniref:Uncharacterized protein n=1 Tax=Erythroxylum novogranatense TaxID=1862640 RepID=A0AAV8TXR0_9ROSI|nr:hypothetical protein K2173_017969 [Erythroxylum novogranatense]